MGGWWSSLVIQHNEEHARNRAKHYLHNRGIVHSTRNLSEPSWWDQVRYFFKSLFYSKEEIREQIKQEVRNIPNNSRPFGRNSSESPSHSPRRNHSQRRSHNHLNGGGTKRRMRHVRHSRRARRS
jgi:hypothetical protein